VALYATAAAIWLGMTLWAIGSDCGPDSTDGQCGMSTFFGIMFGIVGGLPMVLSALASGASPSGVFPTRRRISIAALAAISIAIVAVDLFTVLDNVLMRSQPVSEGVAFGIRMLPVIGFVGAPFVFAILSVAATASYRRIQKLGHVSAFWVCGVAAGAGMLLGLLTPRGLAFGFRGRPWMVSAGLILGVAAGWVFWRVGLRGNPPSSLSGLEVDARDAI
jgi:hypothetical protein